MSVELLPIDCLKIDTFNRLFGNRKIVDFADVRGVRLKSSASLKLTYIEQSGDRVSRVRKLQFVLM